MMIYMMKYYEYDGPKVWFEGLRIEGGVHHPIGYMLPLNLLFANYLRAILRVSENLEIYVPLNYKYISQLQRQQMETMLFYCN